MVPIQQISSPCIGLCSTSLGDTICRGCKRFDHEVSGWGGFSDAEREMVERRLLQFLTQVIDEKVEVTDPQLLRRRLEQAAVRFPAYRQGSVLVWDLLRAASRIRDCRQFGFRLRPAYADTPLHVLKEAIDREFYALSEEYYRRYFGPIVRADNEKLRLRRVQRGMAQKS